MHRAADAAVRKATAIITAIRGTTNPMKENLTLPANGVPVRISGIRIDQIDYAASTVLTQRQGHCVASRHGLHSVRKGESCCTLCGAR
jgi:hypothetical protein